MLAEALRRVQAQAAEVGGPETVKLWLDHAAAGTVIGDHSHPAPPGITSPPLATVQMPAETGGSKAAPASPLTARALVDGLLAHVYSETEPLRQATVERVRTLEELAAKRAGQWQGGVGASGPKCRGHGVTCGSKRHGLPLYVPAYTPPD